MRFRFLSALILVVIGLGLAACAPGARPVLDPESQKFFDGARLIMTGPEEDIFKSLPDAASRKEFIEDFWARRNPDPTANFNEFKDEFERRVDYANKHFFEGRKGMDTDRGRIYIYLGAPDRVENFAMHQAESIVDSPEAIRGPMIWWSYYAYELGIAFADYRNNGVYKMSEISGNLMESIDQAKLGATPPSTGGRTLDFTVTYDRARKVLLVAVPVKRVDFSDEHGRLTTRFALDFYVYPRGLPKLKISQTRDFSGTPSEVEALDHLTFELACDLPPGRVYVDAIVSREGSLVRTRKFVPVKS